MMPEPAAICPVQVIHFSQRGWTSCDNIKERIHASSPDRNAGPVASPLCGTRNPHDPAAPRHFESDGNRLQAPGRSQILRKAQKLDASVDRSTVYRTLQLLKRHGLIDELDLMHINGEGHYYERKMNRDHIHMACLRCGRISEFVSDMFEKLKGQVEETAAFGS